MEIYDLTKQQQLIKNYLQIQVKLFGKGFYSARERCIGKTVIINNLGLEYQSLGYEVYVATPTFYSNDYVANEKWDIRSENNRGKYFSDKTIILVDELNIEETDRLINSLKKYPNGDKVKILGFVRF